VRSGNAASGPCPGCAGFCTTTNPQCLTGQHQHLLEIVRSLAAVGTSRPTPTVTAPLTLCRKAQRAVRCPGTSCFAITLSRSIMRRCETARIDSALCRPGGCRGLPIGVLLFYTIAELAKVSTCKHDTCTMQRARAQCNVHTATGKLRRQVSMYICIPELIRTNNIRACENILELHASPSCANICKGNMQTCTCVCNGKAAVIREGWGPLPFSM